MQTQFQLGSYIHASTNETHSVANLQDLIPTKTGVIISNTNLLMLLLWQWKCYITVVTSTLVICLICMPSALGPVGFGHIYQANPSCPCYNLTITCIPLFSSNA